MIEPIMKKNKKKHMSKQERRQSRKASIYYTNPETAQIVPHPEKCERPTLERLPSIDMIIRRNSLHAAMAALN